jgi:hypothetical protein
MVDQIQLKDVEYFNCLGNTKTNDKKCARKIKSRIAMVKSSIQEEEESFY